MKELLTFSKKAKTIAGFIVLAIIFSFGGCDSGTSPIPQSHPENIGYVSGVDIRVSASAGLTPEEKTSVFNMLEYAISYVLTEEEATLFGFPAMNQHPNFGYLKIIRITGFSSEQSTRKNLEGGIIEAVIHPTQFLLTGILLAALNEGWANGI